MDDNELKSRLLAREKDAIQILLESHGSTIKSVVYRYLGSLTDAREECINDVLMNIWEHIEQFEPQRSTLRSWIAAICRYRAIDYRRKEYHRIQTISLDECTENGIQTPSPAAVEFSAETDAILQALPADDRVLLIALYAEGESAEALAKERNLSKGGVYKRAERAKERLRCSHPERINSKLKQKG